MLMVISELLVLYVCFMVLAKINDTNIQGSNFTLLIPLTVCSFSSRPVFEFGKVAKNPWKAGGYHHEVQ